MYRNSPEAHRLIKALTRSGMPGHNGRRLERWYQDRMLWPRELTPATLGRRVDHCRLLATLTHRGKDNDRAARIMLSRCYPADRSRDALARLAGYDSAADTRAEPLIDSLTDSGFAQIEREAANIQRLIDEGVNPGLPRVFRELVEAIMRWVKDGADLVRDEQTGQPATPEQVKHTMGTNVMAWGIGDGPYDLSWLYALAGTDPSDEDVDLADAPYLFGGGMFNMIDQAIAEASIELLTVTASAARHFLQAMAEARPVAVLNDADDRDELAAMWAPVMIGMMKTARPEVREMMLDDIETACRAERRLPASYLAELAPLRDLRAAG